MKKKILSIILTALIVVLCVFTVCSCAPSREDDGAFFETGDYDYYEHWVEADGGKYIYGRIDLPKDFDKTKEYPTFIMSHGYTATFRVYDNYVKHLTKAGFVCYTFDFCGGAPSNFSDGDFKEMSVLTEKSDLKHVLADIKGQSFFKPSKIYLMGESQGGLVTAITAPEVADDIESIVLLYPGFGIPDEMREKYPNKADIPDNPRMLWETVGKRYVEDVYDLDSYTEAAKYTGRVRIYHGDKDELVPYSCSEKAVKSYENATLTKIEGAKHGFSAREAERVCKDLIANL